MGPKNSVPEDYCRSFPLDAQILFIPIFFTFQGNTKLYVTVNEKMIPFSYQINLNNTNTSVCDNIETLLQELIPAGTFAIKKKFVSQTKLPTENSIIFDLTTSKSELTETKDINQQRIFDIFRGGDSTSFFIAAEVLVSHVEFVQLFEKAYTESLKTESDQKHMIAITKRHVRALSFEFKGVFKPLQNIDDVQQDILAKLQSNQFPDLETVETSKADRTFWQKIQQSLKQVSKQANNNNVKLAAGGLASAAVGAGAAYYKMNQKNKLLLKQMDDIRKAIQDNRFEDAKKLSSSADDLEINPDIF